jgi:hypothetical protein
MDEVMNELMYMGWMMMMMLVVVVGKEKEEGEEEGRRKNRRRMKGNEGERGWGWMYRLWASSNRKEKE